MGLSLIESVGYRHMTVIWRLRGLISFLRGRTEWGAMERRGIGTARWRAVNETPLARE